MRLKSIMLLLGLYTGSLMAQGYELKFKITGAEDTTIYLAHYMGKQLYYSDTAYSDVNGKFAFTGDEPLLGGMYAVICPGPKYFDLMINDEKLYIETDTTDFYKNMVIKNSTENEIWVTYLKFLGTQREKSTSLQTQLEECEKDENANCQELIDEIMAINNEVKTYQANLVKDNEGTLVAKIINMEVDPVVPDELMENDSLRYLWGLQHYFDNIDVADERLVQSPMFHNKIDYYMTKMLIQHPDTICNSLDRLVAKTDPGSQMFRYLVHTFMNHFNQSKIMGMDAVFVCIAEKYYCSGLVTWMSETQMGEICDRVDELKPVLIGKTATNVTLLDTSNARYQSLFDIESDWTMVIIWDPNCGHCKEEMPHYIELYDTWRDHGFEVFAINNGLDAEKEWKEYIIEHELEWINVHDIPEMRDQATLKDYIGPGKSDMESINFRRYFDVQSTPKVFLLDSDFTIVAKQFSAESLGNILAKEYERLHGKLPEFDDREPDGEIEDLDR